MNNSIRLIIENNSDSDITYVASSENTIGESTEKFSICKSIIYTKRTMFLPVLWVCLAMLAVSHCSLLYEAFWGRWDRKKLKALSMVTCISIIIIRFFGAYLSGYSHNEVWGGYIDKANCLGLRSILVGDAGYCPLPNKIVALICSYLPIGRGTQCGVLYTFSVVFILYVLVRILDKEYDYILPLKDRMLLLLLSICLLQNEQMITFLNYSYFSIYLVFLIYIQDIDGLKRGFVIRDCVLSLFLSSKGILIAFLPALIVITGFDGKERKTKRLCIDFSCICALLMQVIYSIFFSSYSMVKAGKNELVKLFLNVIPEFLHIVRSFILQYLSFENPANRAFLWLVAIVILAFSFYLLYWFFKEKYAVWKGYFLLFFSAGISVFICAVGGYVRSDYSQRYMLGGQINGGYTKNVFMVLCYVFATLFLCVLYFRLKGRREEVVLTYFLGIVLLFGSLTTIYTDHSDYRYLYSSNYSIYNHIDEIGAVPLDVEGRFSIRESGLTSENPDYIGYFGNGQILQETTQTSWGNYIYYGVTDVNILEGELIEECGKNVFAGADSFSGDYVGIYCVKAFEGQDNDIYLSLYDAQENLVMRCKKIISENSLLAYIIQKKDLNEVDRIYFENENGDRLSLKNVMWICGINK